MVSLAHKLPNYMPFRLYSLYPSLASFLSKLLGENRELIQVAHRLKPYFWQFRPGYGLDVFCSRLLFQS